MAVVFSGLDVQRLAQQLAGNPSMYPSPRAIRCGQLRLTVTEASLLAVPVGTSHFRYHVVAEVSELAHPRFGHLWFVFSGVGIDRVPQFTLEIPRAILFGGRLTHFRQGGKNTWMLRSSVWDTILSARSRDYLLASGASCFRNSDIAASRNSGGLLDAA
jgi:hypothetical protein